MILAISRRPGATHRTWGAFPPREFLSSGPSCSRYKASAVNEMAFKVQVGPAQIAIHQGQTVLVTEPDGQVNWPSDRGLYFRDTRVISAWAMGQLKKRNRPEGAAIEMAVHT